MIKIALSGRPLSTNHIYGQTKFGRYLKPNAKILKANYIEQLKDQYDGLPLEGKLEIFIDIYWYGKEPDIDNVHKLSLDACNGILRQDDEQINQATIRKIVKDNKHPRMEIGVQKQANK